MNEQTPRDPQQPDHDGAEHLPGTGAHDPGTSTPGTHDPAPRDPARASDASDEHTAVIDGSSDPAPKRSRGILKPVLIGSAAALSVLAVAGVGMTIADAVDDEDETDRQTTSVTPGASTAPGATAAPDASQVPSASAEPDDDSAPSGTGAAAASGDEAALIAAIDAAIAAADGGQATGIEVERDGWKVDVRLDDGSEVDVRVPVSGEAIVRDDDDDRSNDLPLEPARIGEISAAAIAAAGGGEVRSIETDDDQVRFEVEVVLGGEEIDIDLADDLAVLDIDR